MTCELSYLNHARVLPQTQLVLAEAMTAEDFSFVPAPLQSAHLGCCVNGIQHSSSVCVGKLDAPISCTTTRCKQVALKRAPCQCLDSSLVRRDAVRRAVIVGVPYMQQVVIPTTCELLAIW